MSLGSDNKRSFICSADSQNWEAGSGKREAGSGKREAGRRKSQIVIFGRKTFAHDTPAVTKLFETCNMVYL